MGQDHPDQNRFINPSNARSIEQLAVMEEIKRQGHCPFCQENLKKYHTNPILTEGRFWYLTENRWPYDKVKHQLLAIYKTHIEHIEKMDPAAGSELITLFAEESRKRKMTGGGVAIRFGSSEFGDYGSTVLHVHAHLIEPDLEKLEKNEAWKFKFGQPVNYRKIDPQK